MTPPQSILESDPPRKAREDRVSEHGGSPAVDVVVPAAKRRFDLAIAILGFPMWGPMLLLSSLLLLITNGWPVFYVSRRRVFGKESIRMFKFRVMVRNADRIANRETVPVTGERFLNIPMHSELYSRTGRWLERGSLTELPQMLHVLTGRMSVIGNRPLPENVIDSLREAFPAVEQRFAAKAGLAGPVQLVGRDRVSDAERLGLEISYARLCASSYSPRLDLFVLVNTVLICLKLRRRYTVPEVEAIMAKCCATSVRAGQELLGTAESWDREIRESVTPTSRPARRSSGA